MTSFEREDRRLKIFCKTDGCMNKGGGQKSTHRNVRDFSDESKLEAIEAFKAGTRIRATSGVSTQGRWQKTKTGWLCERCSTKKQPERRRTKRK